MGREEASLEEGADPAFDLRRQILLTYLLTT